jgi:integrase/recombinase XerD
MSGYIERVADAIATILACEGLDYTQTKAVFKAARQKAGLTAPKEKRGAPARLSLEEELRFIDQAYAQSGHVGLMIQTLLETGARVSEFVGLRVEDISLAERVITVENGKGGKRREVPIRAELARLLALHIGRRRAGPLFVSRQKSKGGRSRVYTRQRIGQMVHGVAVAAGIGKRIYPHLLRHTIATRLLALGMDIADIQRFLGHDDISTTRIYAETSVAMLRRKFDAVTAPAGQALIREIASRQGEVVAAFASDLLSGDRRRLVSTIDA